MIDKSLGIFETNSISASIKALSLIIKENSVNIINKQVLGEGIVALVFTGNLGAMKKAFNKGAEHLSASNEFRAFHIIPMPHKNLLSLFGIRG
ncbi:MAG: BMC domain-containing protein [Ignavibacteriota bacterium]|nr:BMC domain-containing protein [Ignavibacterium sp.]MCO6447501.1 BMC domain-containing protein [Ignavibacterium album]MCZ2267285.1 BMC domain-containing protein [Ignavibacteriales bacterium]MDX9711909.1 BMC domain-containing protein [Ignavibacteriaceae bacterium]QKJ99426.1 MAG: BMC domain-containing protein [Ignavibacteriota bacterium]